jgi:hypothetical protein
MGKAVNQSTIQYLLAMFLLSTGGFSRESDMVSTLKSSGETELQASDSTDL